MLTIEYAAELDPLLDLSLPSHWVAAVVPEMSQTLSGSDRPEDRLFAELFSGGDPDHVVATQLAFLYYRGMDPDPDAPSSDNQISVRYRVDDDQYDLSSVLDTTTVSTADAAVEWLGEQFLAVETHVETYAVLIDLAEDIHGLANSGVQGLVETFGTLDAIRQADVEAMAEVSYVDEEMARAVQAALADSDDFGDDDPTPLEAMLQTVEGPLIWDLQQGPIAGELVPSNGDEPRFVTEGFGDRSSGDSGSTSDPTDRYVVEIGSGTVAHIVDMNADESDSGPGPSLTPDLPGEKMCSRGHRHHGFERVTLAEFATRNGIETPSFEGEPPEGICSYCWSNTLDAIEQQAAGDEDGHADRIGAVGYRLRWKQKGRARDEWYDIVVGPETTMEELDTLVCRFTTLDDFHLRMYGLEDEYLDSSLNVLPDNQYEYAGDLSYTKASEMTIADVADRAGLWEGDRLSLVYDFGTPSHYYCIVEDVYEPEEVERILEGDDVIVATDTAAILKEKRP